MCSAHALLSLCFYIRTLCEHTSPCEPVSERNMFWSCACVHLRVHVCVCVFVCVCVCVCARARLSLSLSLSLARSRALSLPACMCVCVRQRAEYDEAKNILKTRAQPLQVRSIGMGVHKKKKGTARARVLYRDGCVKRGENVHEGTCACKDLCVYRRTCTWLISFCFLCVVTGVQGDTCV